MFEYRIDRNGEEAVVLFSGSFSVRDSAKVKSELQSLTSSGVKKLIFDFSKLTYLDSSGIGVMLHAYTWIKEKKGFIQIQNMSNEVKTIFTISNLLDIFNAK
ncbi:STAS domain-containing protein [Leptospira idonii]|uniref:Anti-sigma factor antagonist n=1 Tax=Leptospira idonii TaxID=1193500 RepID=A0A4R9M4G3_9LEPT|nr:STAS domain-containing protein [Leptospira idonii]TGN20139.1 anti-sigma factor antagonist [Leptospira idonii]